MVATFVVVLVISKPSQTTTRQLKILNQLDADQSHREAIRSVVEIYVHHATLPRTAFDDAHP